MTKGPTKLRNEQVKIPNSNTTEFWNAHATMVPKKDEFIIYTDGSSYVNEKGETVFVPLVKLGNGVSYLGLLPFLGEDVSRRLTAHINDEVRHITAEEREKWNKKLTVKGATGIVGSKVIFTQD